MDLKFQSIGSDGSHQHGVAVYPLPALHIQEAGSELNSYRNNLDMSPEHLSSLELRLQKIHDLARKHHTPPEHIHEILPSLEQKKAALTGLEAHLKALDTSSSLLIQRYEQTAKKVTTERRKNAKKLSKKITELR